MNVVENDVRALVDKELAAANERFPQFHSQHEGYAVIKEEVDELKEYTDLINNRMIYLWAKIRFNNSCEEIVSRILTMPSTPPARLSRWPRCARSFWRWRRKRNEEVFDFWSFRNFSFCIDCL